MKAIKIFCHFLKDLVRNNVLIGVNISETRIRLNISDVLSGTKHNILKIYFGVNI